MLSFVDENGENMKSRFFNECFDLIDPIGHMRCRACGWQRMEPGHWGTWANKHMEDMGGEAHFAAIIVGAGVRV